MTVLPFRYIPSRHITPCHEATRYKHEDNLTESGAHKLAATLDEFWHSNGYPTAKHWVEPCKGVAKGGAAFAVKSNLVNGIPPPRVGMSSREPIPSAEDMARRLAGMGAATPLATPTPKAVSEAPATFLDGAAVGEWLRTREGKQDA